MAGRRVLGRRRIPARERQAGGTAGFAVVCRLVQRDVRDGGDSDQRLGSKGAEIRYDGCDEIIQTHGYVHKNPSVEHLPTDDFAVAWASDCRECASFRRTLPSGASKTCRIPMGAMCVKKLRFGGRIRESAAGLYKNRSTFVSIRHISDQTGFDALLPLYRWCGQHIAVGGLAVI